jgi:hypothetical protein
MVQGYYTLQEAAHFLSMHVDELKQMAQKGQIRSFQDRGTLRFRVQDIQELARTRGSSDEDQPVLSDAPSSKARPASDPALKSPSPRPRPPSGEDIQLGSAGAGSPSSAARKSPKSPLKQGGPPDVFGFDVEADNVDIGADLPRPSSGVKSGSKTRKAPTPTPGSDSDVRLVADGSDVTFSVPKDSDIKVPDSDVKISPDPLKPKSGVHASPPSSGSKHPSQLALGSGTKPKSKLGDSPKPAHSPRPGASPQPADSGVRLVPMDDDSDVKLHGSSDEVNLGGGDTIAASDSNVRLEKVGLPPADSAEGNLQLTEEINLDEELKKQQEQEKDKPPTKVKAKSELKLPTTSPFELSDSDLELPSELKGEAAGPKTPRVAKGSEVSDSSDFDLAVQKPGGKEGSSDFDLVPGNDGNVMLDSGDSDFSLEANDEQVLDAGPAAALGSASSGINLNNPADEGISLEEGDGSDFDLSLEVEDTPKPQKSSPIDDSDSEFELTTSNTPKPSKGMEDESDSEFDLSLDPEADAPAAEGDSSEFELNLEGSGEVAASDGEFELTLDDNAPKEEEKPQVKSKSKLKVKGKTKMKPASDQEQDIFDTDFEVPALEESSSDDATVADSELESSDFDLALDDSELAQEEESGSQVVALDEEDVETMADDGAAVVDDVEVDEESDFAALDEDIQVEDDVVVEGEVRTRTVVEEKLIPPAPWGVVPVIFMLPCVLVMFLVAILGFEMLQTASGKPPGMLTIALADLFQTPITGKR